MAKITKAIGDALGITAAAKRDRAAAEATKCQNELAVLQSERAAVEARREAADTLEAHQAADAELLALASRIAFASKQVTRAEDELNKAQQAANLEALDAEAKEARTTFEAAQLAGEEVARKVAALHASYATMLTACDAAEAARERVKALAEKAGTSAPALPGKAAVRRFSGHVQAGSARQLASLRAQGLLRTLPRPANVTIPAGILAPLEPDALLDALLQAHDLGRLYVHKLDRDKQIAWLLAGDVDSWRAAVTDLQQAEAAEREHRRAAAAAHEAEQRRTAERHMAGAFSEGD